jgi:hypothetical protein
VEANCPTVLPVVWSSPLTVRAQGKEVLLDWQVSSQQDNDYFSVERSPDGVSFSTIGSLPGSQGEVARTNYTFTDQDPLSGVNYYRVRQVDVDGQYSFSNIALGLVDEISSILVYPNPVKDILYITGVYKPEEVITIHNAFGGLVYRGPAANGEILLSDFPSGIYVLKIGNQQPVKILKSGLY